jgi:hypothetical protein
MVQLLLGEKTQCAVIKAPKWRLTCDGNKYLGNLRMSACMAGTVITAKMGFHIKISPGS